MSDTKPLYNPRQFFDARVPDLVHIENASPSRYERQTPSCGIIIGVKPAEPKPGQ
jgi:hypothetical protein